MECDFCGQQSSRLLKICCLEGEVTCLECVRSHMITSQNQCSHCGIQLGKKIKPLFQEMLRNQPYSNFQGSHQQSYGSPMQSAYQPQYMGPQGYNPQYGPSYQNYPQPWVNSQWIGMEGHMAQSRVRSSMPMQMGYYNNQGFFPQNYIEPNLDRQLYQTMIGYVGSPNFGAGQMRGGYDFEPQEPVYRRGQMVRPQRGESLTTDHLQDSRHQSQEQSRLNRSNSSISLRRRNPRDNDA